MSENKVLVLEEQIRAKEFSREGKLQRSLSLKFTDGVNPQVHGLPK